MPFPPGQSAPSTRRRTLQGAALMLAGGLLCGTAAMAQVKKEVNQPEFHLKFQKTIGILPRQHIIIFEKLAPAEAAKTETEKP